jgi:hypothetical protein
MDPERVEHVLNELEDELVAGDPGFERCLHRLERRLARADRRNRRRRRWSSWATGAEAMLWSLALASGSGVVISAWYEAYRQAALPL